MSHHNLIGYKFIGAEGDPTVQDVPETPKSEHNEWATSLCNCCGDERESSNQCQFFCCSLFCQPCAQATLQQHAGLADNCCLPCCCYSFSFGTVLGSLIPCIALFNLDRNVARLENIDETCCYATCKVCCCFPCTMSQINSHLILKNKEFNVAKSTCSCSHLMGCVGDAQLVEARPKLGRKVAPMPPVQNSMDQQNYQQRDK